MFTNDGEPVLPFIAHTLTSHVESLEIIKNLAKGKIIIPAHGVVLHNYDEIIKDINNRLKYFEYIKSGFKDIEVFNNQNGLKYVNEKFHAFNLRNAKL